MEQKYQKYHETNSKIWSEKRGKEDIFNAKIDMIDGQKGTQIILISYQDIPSTMIPADEWPQELVTEHTSFLFQARAQVQGQGQHNNKWLSPPGNLYMTYLVKINPKVASVLSIVACTAILRTIKQNVPELKINCKWVNDVFIEDKKVAGVLTRCSIFGDKFVAKIGVGVNLNADPPEGATNLLKYSKGFINVPKFTEDLIKNIDRALLNEQQSLAVYQQSLLYVNQKVNIFDEQLKKILNTGVFRGINSYGHAILEDNLQKLTVNNGRMRKATQQSQHNEDLKKQTSRSTYLL